MYEELVKSLRNCADAACNGCKNELVQIGCRGKLQREAADAIEELSAIREEQKAQFVLMAAEIEEQKPSWVSVEEWLPEAECGDFSKNVLVTDGECIAISSYFNCDEMEPYWCYTGIGEITHWMPLPEPPKEET